MANIVKISFVNATDKEILSNQIYAEEGVLTYTETGLFLGLGDNKIIKYPKSDLDQFTNKAELDTLLQAKANSVDTYSKADVDEKIVSIVTRQIVDLSNYYNKQQCDVRFDDFLCKHTVYTKNETYTKKEADRKIQNAIDLQLNDFYSKAEVNNKLATKANLANVYNKLEIDEKVQSLTNDKVDALTLKDYYNKNEVNARLDCKANIEDIYDKVEVTNFLNDKASKDDVYDIADMDDLLSKKADQHHTFTKTEVVDLMATKAEVTLVYSKIELEEKLALALLPKADAQDIIDNYYDKSTIDEKLVALKKLLTEVANGAQVEIDLTDYYTKEQANARFATKDSVALDMAATKTAIKAEVKTETKDEVVAAVGDIVNQKVAAKTAEIKADIITEVKGDVTTDIKKEITDALKVTHYNKDDVDNKFITKDHADANFVSNTLYTTEKANVLATKAELARYATVDSITQLTAAIDKKADHDAMQDFYNQEEIDDLLADVKNNIDLTNYYDKAEVDQKLAQAAAGGNIDLTGYATKAELNNKADTTALADLATKAEIANFVTTDVVDNKIAAIPAPDMGNYYDKAEVDQKLAQAAAGGNIDLTGYATKAELNNKADTTALADLATKAEIANFVTTDVVDNKIAALNLNDKLDAAGVEAKIAEKLGNVANITGNIGDEAVDTENLVEVINMLITYTGTLKAQIETIKNQIGVQN